METRESALVRLALAVHRLDEIEPLVRAAVPFDGHAVLLELGAREEAGKQAGRVAESEFLAFIRPVIEKAVREHGFLPATGTPIDSLGAWFDHAVALPSLLSMFTFARRHRHLLGDDGFTRARELVLGNGWQPRSDQHVVALVAVGFAAGDAEDRAVARLFWAMRSCKVGQTDHAKRHIAKVRDELTQVRDDSERRTAYFFLGAACQGVADLDSAIEAYTAAVDPRADGQDLLVQYALATCLREASRNAEALAALEGVRFDAREPGLELSIQARALRLRGLLHEDNGEYDLAVADHEVVVQLAARLGDRLGQFQARTSVAVSLSRAGRHREAVRAGESVLILARQQADPTVLAGAHNNLGAVLLAKGDTTAARAQYVAAMNCRTAQQCPSLSEAISLFGLGDTWRDDEDDELAGTMYLMAFTHARHATDELTALTYYLPRMRRSDRSVPAEHLDRLRAAIDRAEETANWLYHNTLAAVLADHLAATGQRARALSLRRRLLAYAEKSAPGCSVAINDRVKLAELLTAEVDGCQEALDLLWDARTELDGRLRQALVEQRRSEILAAHVRVYDLLIHLLAHSDAQLTLPDERGRGELAFDLHEEAKSRSFLTGLSRGPVPAAEPVPPHLLHREAELLLAERRLQRSQWVAGTRAGRDRLARLGEIHAELSRIWAEMRLFAPEYVRLRQAQPLNLIQARELLSRHAPDGGMAMVSYFVGSDETTCFVLRSDDERLRICRIALADTELGRVAERLRVTFNGDPGSYPPVAPLRGRHPQRRSIAFLDDIGPELLSFTAHTAGLPLVCIAPHGPLHLLPLHALPADNRARLIDTVAAAYCPSLSSLAHVMVRPRATGHHGETSFVAGVAAQEDAAHELFEHDDSLLTGTGWPVRSVSGVDATHDAVLAGLAESSVAHLTCHGYFNPAEPLESGLLLAHGGLRPSKEVRRLSVAQRHAQMLSVRDLADIQAPLRLLVLRACSAGSLGQENSGDEFSGLIRAFLHGGASSVIAPMWNVDQRSSRVFLARLYQEWRERPTLPLWRLFWQTQRWMLSRVAEPWITHPYHWSPFVLVGDWR